MYLFAYEQINANNTTDFKHGCVDSFLLYLSMTATQTCTHNSHLQDMKCWSITGYAMNTSMYARMPRPCGIWSCNRPIFPKNYFQYLTFALFVDKYTFGYQASRVLKITEVKPG